MPTPTKEQIKRLASELYMKANPDFNLPETGELKEESYWTTAQNALMGSEAKSDFDYENISQLDLVDQMAHDIGKRLVNEKDYDRLIEIEKRIDLAESKEKQLAILEHDLRQLQDALKDEKKPAIVTLEKVVTEIKWKTRRRRKKRIVEHMKKHKPFFTLDDLNMAFDLLDLKDQLLINKFLQEKPVFTI